MMNKSASQAQDNQTLGGANAGTEPVGGAAGAANVASTAQSQSRDVAQEAFEMYSQGMFQESIKLIQKVEQQIDNVNSESGSNPSGTASGGPSGGNGADKGGPGGGSSSQHIIGVEEKKQRVQHNMLLAGYFKNKGKDPHGLLKGLIELHEHHQSGDTIARAAPPYNMNQRL